MSGAPKLTKTQALALATVCATNGGGVRLSCRVTNGQVLPTNAAYRKLFELGLIQGKSGGYSTVVHTREGLALNRAIAHHGEEGHG